MGVNEFRYIIFCYSFCYFLTQLASFKYDHRRAKNVGCINGVVGLTGLAEMTSNDAFIREVLLGPKTWP